MTTTNLAPSGVTLLDTDIDEMDEDAEFQHFQTEEPVTIQVGETAGNAVTVDAQYFIAASIDAEADEMTQMMTGQDRINESSVFISNEGGEVGGGFIQVEEGEIEDALDQFAEEHL